MAPATNWLSFSLSPMEMLKSSQSATDHHQYQFIPYEASSTRHYFQDSYYANGWNNPKEVETSLSGETTMLSSFAETHHQPHHAPKLEDFLGDNSCQTDATQDDSSLTHIFNNHRHGPAVSYFARDHHDLKSILGFPSFSANSSSEVDDSSNVRAHQQLGIASNGLFLGVSGECKMTNYGCYNYRDSQASAEKSAIVVSTGEDADCTKKIIDNFGQRTSIYRGVTRHRWTGRYEAHLWDNSCRREGQARKGRQVYLGGYDKEEKAARAYDLAALKYWGPTATTNFPVSNYSKELEEMKYISKQEFIASLRRKSSGFSRGASIYRGVTRHHQQGRWQARIGRVAGNKDLYLGTFATEEEAAEAYDIAAIKFRGLNAVTNFEMNRYDVEAIMKSALPIGGAAKRVKIAAEGDQKAVPTADRNSHHNSGINVDSMQAISTIPCGIPFDTGASAYHHGQLLHHFQPPNFPAVESLTATSPMVPPSEFFIWPTHHSY